MKIRRVIGAAVSSLPVPQAEANVMDLQWALLADIEVDPGDDTPWLVLADWLEDQQLDSQAELVRLSLQLRRHDPVPDDPAPEIRFRELVASGLRVPLPRRLLLLGPGVPLELVLVPPGRFRMGSPPSEPRRDADEGPVHSVSLSRGFWMGVTAVTQLQWETVMGGHAPGRFRGPTRPVDGVSWVECQEFLRRVSRLHPETFRLPSEAEWEYACRACTTTAFSFGPTATSHQANFDGNYPYEVATTGPWLEHTAPVGSYPANGWGLFDVHGNIWEWCNDWYDDEYYARSPAADPPGPLSGTQRVLRGGSWYSYSWSCRSAGRERFAPESGAGNYGFRVVMDVGPGQRSQ